MSRTTWRSPIVRAFWNSAGGRSPINAVERVCDELLQRLGTQEPPYQSNNYEYAKMLGISIVEQGMDMEGTVACIGSRFIIRIKRESSPERKNFTVCHEIGHIEMLQRSGWVSRFSQAEIAQKSTSITEEERLADLFAANLLMPRKIFKEKALHMPPGLESLFNLAKAFKTSLDSTVRRILHLNLWTCQTMWCVPESLFVGGFAARIIRLDHAQCLRNPPIKKTRFTRTGINCVRESYQKRTFCADTFSIPNGLLGTITEWKIECVRQRDLVFAIMTHKLA